MSYDLYLEADLGGGERETLYDLLQWNYTSNCARMWRKAMPSTDGLAGLDGKSARTVRAVVKYGIEQMESNPAAYRAMNPPNGWGSFDSQLEALRELLRAVEKAPNTYLRVSR